MMSRWIVPLDDTNTMLIEFRHVSDPEVVIIRAHRGSRRADRGHAGYAAGALQPLLVMFSTCEGVDCPSNPILIADDGTIANAIETVQSILAVVAVRGHGRRAACAAGGRRPVRNGAAWNRCCGSAR